MNKLKRLRILAGYTQMDIANMFGISNQSYSKKELGRVAFKDTEKVLFMKLIKETSPDETIESVFFEHLL